MSIRTLTNRFKSNWSALSETWGISNLVQITQKTSTDWNTGEHGILAYPGTLCSYKRQLRWRGGKSLQGAKFNTGLGGKTASRWAMCPRIAKSGCFLFWLVRRVKNAYLRCSKSTSWWVDGLDSCVGGRYGFSILLSALPHGCSSSGTRRDLGLLGRRPVWLWTYFMKFWTIL